MAQFVFTFDSVNKTLTATKDGEPFDNLSDVVFYGYKGKFEMGACQRLPDKGDGTETWVRTQASEDLAVAADPELEARKARADALARVFGRKAKGG